MRILRGTILVLLMSVPRSTGEENLDDMAADGTNPELVEATTEEPWATPFPPGDVLNDPWFRKIKYIFPKDEAILDGLRNMYPLSVLVSRETDGGVNYYMGLDEEKLKQFPVDPKKLYCYLRAWPWNANPLCVRGSESYFNRAAHKSPLGMLRTSIPTSTLNAICAALAIVLGVFGNILIFISVVTRKELRTSTNLLLAGVTVIDCLNSLVIVLHGYPYSIFMDYIDNFLGPPGCTAIQSIKQFILFAAINHLVTISFERYFAICWPLKRQFKFTPKKVVVALVLNWLVAGTQIIPYTIYVMGSHVQSEKGFRCKLYQDFESGFPWTYYSLVLYIILPVLIQCFTYGSVIRTLLASIKKMKTSTGNDSGPVNAERARLKLVYMLITLVVIYILTVLPAWVHNTLLLNIGVRTGDITQRVKRGVLFELLQSLNSSTNVVVYTIVSRQFREAFKEMLCCRKKNPSPDLIGKRPAV